MAVEANHTYSNHDECIDVATDDRPEKCTSYLATRENRENLLDLAKSTLSDSSWSKSLVPLEI
jgi:hypothetical protein